MLHNYKKLYAVLLACSSITIAMDVNQFGWEDTDQALNFISDNFSNNYLNNSSSLSDSSEHDYPVDITPQPVIQQNIIINNYFFPQPLHQPQYDQVVPYNVPEHTVSGTIRKREDEPFVQVKRQRLVARAAKLYQDSMQNDYSSTPRVAVPHVINLPAKPESAHNAQDSYAVNNAINITKAVADTKTLVSYDSALQVSHAITEEDYINTTVDHRKSTFKGSCCGTPYDYTQLAKHIRDCHMVMDATLKAKYKCPFPDCTQHKLNTSNHAMALHFMSHTMPDLGNCPKCQNTFSPSSLKSHYLKCTPKQLKFINYQPHNK